VHFTKTLAVQLGRFGITVNCIHPGVTRTERTPRLLAARAKELGISAYLTAFLASDKAWAVTGELVVATGGAGRSVYY
jgi:NAD(P)-dependent dehydrogenase (short-subunit alcohol dehydrogenase family)